jgi:hypothetical protein
MAAQDPNKDNLEGLVSVRQQLAANTDEIHRQVREMGLLGTEFNNILNYSKGLNSSLAEAEKLQADINKSFFTEAKTKKTIESLDNHRKLITTSIAAAEIRMSKENLASLKVARMAQVILKERDLEITKISEELEKGNLSRKEALKLQVKLQTLNRQNLATNQTLNEATSSKAVKQGLLLDFQKQAVESAIEYNQKIKDSNKLWTNLGAKVQDLGKRLGKLDVTKGLLAGLGLSGGVADIFKNLVESAFQWDNSLTNIGKSSGLTRELSEDIGQSYVQTVHSIKMMNSNLDAALLTITGMLKSQQELQASSGQMSLFDEKRVQDQLYLTKQLGLQAEEGAKVQHLAMLSEQTTSKTTDDIYEQVAASNRLTGLRTSGLDVLKAVAKVEGALAFQYKNNPKLIAAAVAQSKALGMNLEQAAQASASLLDFESSIANELEAELLTGKRWNLEKARSLALDGDAAGAAREMLKNIGSYADFMKQNVISRQAEAKAVGMTADELSNSMRSQELMKGFSKETLAAIDQSGDKAKYMAQLNAATNAKEMQAAQGRVSTQMKFEESMVRVREAIGIMAAGPMLSIVNGIASITENALKLKLVLIGTAAIMSTIAASSMITAFGISLATGGANLAVGLTALAGAGLTGAMLFGGSSPKEMHDGLIAPSGQMMISTPAGEMIKPDKNDYLALTTNPGALMNNGGGGSGKTEQLLSAILASVSQPGKVYLDSTAMGTAMGVSYNAYA